MPSFVYTLASGAVILGLFMAYASWSNRRKMLRAPRITADELVALQARLTAARLPVVLVSLVTDSPASATASRIGGRPFIDSKVRKWPVRGKDQVPMLFLAQLNFAETPPIDGFPNHGLLQIFGLADARGQLQGTDRKTDRVIRWYPEPVGGLTLLPPQALLQESKWATFSPRTVADGFGMTFSTGTPYANPCNWPLDVQMQDTRRRLPESEEVKTQIEVLCIALDRQLDQLSDGNWIGGHPRFVQNDVREEPRLRKLNRVLLHLCADNVDIMLGDSGELNLMIGHKDLRAQNFDAAFCTWDCS